MSVNINPIIQRHIPEDETAASRVAAHSPAVTNSTTHIYGGSTSLPETSVASKYKSVPPTVGITTYLETLLLFYRITRF